MRAIFLLAALLVAPAVHAQGESYQATVPVADQSAPTRAPALREALASVLARVSGDAAAAGASAQPILARAGQLVQRYNYERDASGTLRLTAAFDPRAVDAALKGQGLPVFGVYASADEDSLIAVSGIRSARDYALTIATLRGMPGVKSVAVLEASGDILQLRVRSEGGAGRLAGAASIGSVLIRDSNTPGRLSFTLAN